ncbi:alpha/beta fold hydrolase [Noviherbaspirillum pedocola]|uniref:Alpha/beta hydrolase n=1 Tax=Noviherbaspirillum pedocola TaxID=2801341 RepID=A0A934SVC5_9BURK|nr:alpha/beta hydrolase [Noviherbaspirillum pedocola]MBK4737265.1 alpha/beta hydrolase [Noviherbaspirillum pedocola]
MSAWVLLRGLMRESRHWGAFPLVFRGTVGASDIRRPDLPGNGRLHEAVSPSSVAAMVEHYRATLRAEGCRPPYRLLALSLGGMVAAEWASRNPGEVEACVLINTSMRPFSRYYRRLRWQNYPALLRIALAGADVERREAAILGLTSIRPCLHAHLLPTWATYQRECRVTAVNAFRQLLAAARYRAPRIRPSPPVLVLASAGDRLVDCDCSRRLAAAWHVDFALHPDGGHDLPLDDGAWIAQQVRAWLASTVSKGSVCENGAR